MGAHARGVADKVGAIDVHALDKYRRRAYGQYCLGVEGAGRRSNDSGSNRSRKEEQEGERGGRACLAAIPENWVKGIRKSRKENCERSRAQ